MHLFQNNTIILSKTKQKTKASTSKQLWNSVDAKRTFRCYLVTRFAVTKSNSYAVEKVNFKQFIFKKTYYNKKVN